eukprot:5025496-Alexandrium_andersonii.AAC.1
MHARRKANVPQSKRATPQDTCVPGFPICAHHCRPRDTWAATALRSSMRTPAPRQRNKSA